jgi:hypothetical protein
VVYCTWNNHVFGLCPSSNVSKNSTFQKLDLFLFSGKIMGAPTLLGPSLSKGYNSVGAAIILTVDANRSSFRNLVFLETLADGQSPKNMILP